MEREFANMVLDTIGELWAENKGAFSSEQLYDRLISSGIEIKDGQLSKLLTDFKERGIIRAAAYLNREAVLKHGAMTITDVNQAYF